MGYEVEWTTEALHDFQVLREQPGSGLLFVLRAVAGRRHTEWLRGRPFPQFEVTGEEIRLLEASDVGIVYALLASQERVRVLAILRNTTD